MIDHLIANSSPLILLSKIGQLPFLKLTGDRVFIPQAVWDEVTNYPDPKAVPDLSKFPWIQIDPAQEIPHEVLAWNLGKGESAVIALGIKKGSSELIIDDLDARSCARSLGLQVRGTLGLVLLARKKGLITAVRPTIDELIHSGMYLDKGIIDQILRIAGELT